eukprot:1331696-Prorocentrum_lima.AAC.1
MSRLRKESSSKKSNPFADDLKCDITQQAFKELKNAFAENALLHALDFNVAATYPAEHHFELY